MVINGDLSSTRGRIRVAQIRVPMSAAGPDTMYGQNLWVRCKLKLSVVSSLRYRRRACRDDARRRSGSLPNAPKCPHRTWFRFGPHLDAKAIQKSRRVPSLLQFGRPAR